MDLSKIEFFILVEGLEDSPQDFRDIYSAFKAANILIQEDKSFDVISSGEIVMQEHPNIEGVFSPTTQMFDLNEVKPADEALPHLQDAFKVRMSFHWDAASLEFKPRQYKEQYTAFYERESLADEVLPPFNMNGIMLEMNAPKWPSPEQPQA